MHPLRLRTTLFLLATSVLFGVAARPAAAADWTLKPVANQFGADRANYGYTLNPGGELQDGIAVSNAGTTPLHLAVYAADAFATRAGQLGLAAKDAKPAGVGTFVHPSTADVTVAPGDTAEVPFTLTLPKDAASGDYVGGIVTEADGGERVGMQIRLRIGGSLRPSLAVEAVHIDFSGSGNPLGKGDATVSYTIHNTGNAIIAARQGVSVSGPFGRFNVRAGAVEDSPPLLPGASLKVSTPVQSVTPALRLTATVTLVPLLTDASGSTSSLAGVKTSGHAWVLPWALLAVIAVLLVVAIAFWRRLKPARADDDVELHDAVEPAREREPTTH